MLVVALWMLTILALLALSVSGRAGTDLRLTRNHWEEIQCRHAARTAAVRAMLAWRESPDKVGTIQEISVGESLVSVDPEEEAGRISLNEAPLEVLRRLFPEDPSLAAAIVDWRDGDDATLPHGAEARDYLAAPGPRNAPFESVEELLWVKGMTTDLYRDAEPFLTVYGAGKVSLNTASARVLEALGLSRSLVDKILSFRLGEDRQPGTGDDGLFRNLGEVTARMAAFHLSPVEASSLSSVLDRGLVDVRSDLWRFRLSVRLEQSAVPRHFVAVVSPMSGMIVKWREEA